MVVPELSAASAGAPAQPAPPSRPSLQRAWRAAVTATARRSSFLLFAVVPLVLLVGLLWLGRDVLAIDLHNTFRPAAAAVLEGESPYPPATTEAVERRDAFVYLPPAAFAFVPFALVPPLVADLLGMGLMLLFGAGTLWLLGVRDWRCYGAALALAPVLAAVQTANLTLAFACVLAAVWVTRERRVLPGVLLALTLATKLLLWPVLVWWLATRRYASAAVAVLTAAALVGVSWAALSFAGLHEHLELLRLLAATLGGDSYTVFAVAADLGVGEGPARVLGLAVAATVLAASAWLGRRGEEARSFVLAVLASLLFSPLVWLHYFALLLVPIALVHRRLSPLWLLPIAFWACAQGTGNGSTAGTALALATTLAVALLAVRAAPRPAGART